MPRTKDGKLTPKQQRFVEEYPKDWNATQAAIRAGYSRRTAEAIGKENLQKPLVASALQTMVAKITKAANLDLHMMTQRWATIAFSLVCVADYFIFEADGGVTLRPHDQWTEEMKLMCRGATPTRHGWTINLRDRDHAMDMLSKYVTTGGFSDRLMLAGDRDSPLPVQQMPERDPELAPYTREVLKKAQALLAEKRRELEGRVTDRMADPM